MSSQATEVVGEEKISRLRFNRLLEPIKVMLVSRKDKLSREEWLDFVERTRLSVLSHPDEYLGRDLPPHNALVRVVDGIFTEFLQNETELASKK